MATWKTKDGRVLKVSEMETDHIRNALAMLKRKGYCSVADFDDSWMGLAGLRGEMATYYAEQAVDAMRPYRAIDVFEAELARRG